jgi:hypothetical protein
MIIDVNLCWEFLTKQSTRHKDYEDFLSIDYDYETVEKLFEQMVTDHHLFGIYYRLADRTSSALLYQQTKKRPNEFYHHLWKHMINQTINAQPQQLMNYFVDCLQFERKQNQMILLPRDTDQTIQEKIQLFQTKKKFLLQEKITEQGLEAIRRFIQEILSNSLISPWNY